MRKFVISLLILCVGATLATAAPIDNAKKQYIAGDYEAAVKTLLPLKKKTPRDGNVNYYLGASLYELGRIDEAIAPLEVAEERGVADASRILSTIAFDSYRPDEAIEHLDAWEKALVKAKKARNPQIDELRPKAVMMSNMLQRVEKIEIIDSITVDEADFFTHYRLSPEAGQILTPAASEIDAQTMVFTPQNRREMLWAKADSVDAPSVLYGASILDDGTIDTPTPLRGEFAQDGSVDFPYMLSDGITLYFAATGENSLGGYDIFLTRRNDDGFLQPQNIGMPFNSPVDDYMLAIDEATGAGWFASNRSSEPGKVTIYVFIPSQTRVNYPADDPDLADRARISSIADTWTDLDARRDLLAKISAIEESGNRRKADNKSFVFPLGNGKIYTSLDQFTNRQARREMQALIKLDNEIAETAQKLADMRYQYGRGQESLGVQIIDLEQNLEYMRQSRRQQANKVIRLETVNGR